MLARLRSRPLAAEGLWRPLRRGLGSGPRSNSAGEESVRRYPKLGCFRPAQVGELPDGLLRHPSLTSSRGLLRSADYAGTIAFAMNGAITAGSVGMDAVGCTILGCIVAVGGGTIRDSMVLHKQPFWVEEYEYLLMAAAAALATSMVWPSLPSGNVLKDAEGGEGDIIWAFDTLGIGAFAVIGCQNALRMCVHPFIACTCGMMTATFGGFTRDIICSLPKEAHGNGRVMHSHSDLYASAAFAGAAAYVMTRSAGYSLTTRIAAGMIVSMGARVLARMYDLAMPSWDKPGFRTLERTQALQSANTIAPVASPSASATVSN
mmetsp:Transcript_7345/g.14616  ORF Transcript_7345/g.14616 Transcript_7345/m.14616 type:complete len:319 (-) Transcript_7345:356-1312(-)